jgi:hypothetical protein
MSARACATSPRARALVEDAHLLKALEDDAALKSRILRSREQRSIGKSHKVRAVTGIVLDGALMDRGLERSPASNTKSTGSGSYTARSGGRSARSGARSARSAGRSPRFHRLKPEQGADGVDGETRRDEDRQAAAEISHGYSAAHAIYDVLKELESSVKPLFEPPRFGRVGGWDGN